MIPFAKPKFADDSKIRQILRSGQVTNGNYCRLLEEKIKEVSGAEYAVVTNSCTTGLWLAQRALGFFKKKNGLWEKRIAVPAFTWTSTHWNIRNPVFVDCNPSSWNVNRIPNGVDGAVVTHVFGNKCEVEANVPVMADAAHALGLHFNPDYVAEVYSLAPSKTFSGMEGGVVVTNSKALAHELNEDVKWAGRLGEVNAVVALSSLEDWKKKLTVKKEIAHYCMDDLPFQFQDCNRRVYEPDTVMLNGKVAITKRTEVCESTHNEVGVLFPSKAMRDYVQRNIKGVETRIRYRPDERCSAKTAPNAWSIYDRILNVPSWIGVERKAVVEAVKEASFMDEKFQGEVKGWFK